MKILFFGYSWSPTNQLNSYQQSIVNTLVQAGYEVHLFLGNQFAASKGILGFIGNLQYFADYIKKNGFQMVLCMNHAGNHSELRRMVDCPFVTWSSDEFSHLFKPNGTDEAGVSSFLDERTRIFVTSSGCEMLYRRLFPGLVDRIHYMPHCTHVEAFRSQRSDKAWDVSFVGSSLDIGIVQHLLRQHASPEPGAHAVYVGILKAIERLRESYDHNFEATLDELGLLPILQNNMIDPWVFQMFCANLISNNERFQALAALSEFKTAIFGNTLWLDSLGFTIDLAKIYHPERSVTSFADLVDIYQSSKISISIPQHQVGGAIQYRVVDVMASDALLLTKHAADSDLFRVFGEGCPVPMFRSITELKEQCAYYLKNEAARMDLVARCQELITDRFSFEYRLREIFESVGLSFQSQGATGKVIQPSHLPFLADSSFREVAKQRMMSAAHKIRAYLAG